MSKQQSWNLGRTLLVVSVVLWVIQPASFITTIVAALGLGLLWYAETR